MKLWIKSTIGLSTVGFVAGVTIGGIAIFNATNKNVNGNPFLTSKSVDNHFPSTFNKELSQLEAKDLNAYFVQSSSDISTQFATFDVVAKDDAAVTYKGKKVSFDTFNTAFVKKYNTSPVQVVTFGPAIFKNEYLDAVGPKEFCEYVAWFLKNVSWGSDLAALEDFSIMRGIQTDGDGIVLGQHTNTNNEKTAIQFYPDGFFGSLPAYSQEAGEMQQVDNLLAKLTDLNNTLLTKEDIELLVAKKRDIQAASSASDFRIRSIVPVQKIDEPNDPDRNGKMGYEVYIDIYPSLIDDVLAIYPYLGKQLNGLHVERDSIIKTNPDNGEIYRDEKLVDGPYWGIDPTSRIPFLAVLKASNPDFKGVGINWLKYVGQHEYGHHTTLQSLQDGSENGVYAGASSEQKILTSSKYYSLDVINKYLDARAHNISATASTNDSTKGGVNQFIKFVENGVQEDEADVYGAWYPGNIQEAIDDPWRRASRASLSELNEVAVRRGVSLSDLTIENAWDVNSATINPGFSNEAYVYVRDANGNIKLAKTTDSYEQAMEQTGAFLKDGEGNNIVFDATHNQFIVQYWANADGTASTEPVFYQWDTRNGGQALNFTRPNTNNIFDKNGQPITDWSSSTPRITVIKKADGKPAVENDVTLAEVYAQEQAISGFLENYAWNYSISGWESDSTLTSGFRIDTQAYENGDPASYSATESSAVQSFINSGIYGVKRWITYREQGFYKKTQDNINYFAPEMTGMVNDEIKAFGDYFFLPATQGVGYGAFDSLGSFIRIGSEVNGSYYSALPSGVYLPFSSQSNSRTDVSWANFTMQMNGQVEAQMFTIADASDHNKFLATTTDSQNKSAFVLIDKNTLQEGATFHANEASTSAPKLDMFLTGNTITKVGDEILKAMQDPYHDFTKSLFPDFKSLTSDMLTDEILKYKENGPEKLTIQKYVEMFSLDPLKDFKFSTSKVANGATVVSIDAWKRIFDINKIKAANPGMDDEQIELLLTGVMTLEKLFFIKDEMVSIADLEDTTKNESIKALLLGGIDDDASKKSFISREITIRKWFNIQPKASDERKWNEFIEALAAKKTAWNENEPTLKFDDKKLSYNEIALLSGIWRWNPTDSSSDMSSKDFGFAVTVGPTSDARDQMTGRNEEKLSNMFSDYTFNIAEMTNRDYLQITYMPSFSQLENTPSWFKGSSEAESGEEYAIDSSATKVYLEGSIYGLGGLQAYTSLQNALQNVFHFKKNEFGEVEAQIDLTDPSNPKQYQLPSKGIIAAAGVNNWKNYVYPSFIGKPVSKSNGFFKDDLIRRSVGDEIYINGDWKYTISGTDIYEANTSGKPNSKTAAPTPVGTFFTGKKGTIIVDDTNTILIKLEKGVLVPTQAAKAMGWDTIDILTGQIKDAAGNTVAGIDNKGQNVRRTSDQKIVAYVTGNAISLDGKTISWRVVDREIYEYKLGIDYNDPKNLDPQNPANPKKVADIYGNEVYDLNGKPIVDNNIRIKDIYGNAVTDRANAIWQFLIQEKGIGDGLKTRTDSNGGKIITNSGRNIEGLWRSPNRDATYMWGYVPKEMELNGTKVEATDIKYLEFIDLNSGEKKFLSVAIGQDNLFYYKDRGQSDADGNPGIKHTLSEEGFTSWTTDYAAMGGYRDALLLSGHKYSLSLVDKNYKEVMPIDLGSRTVIAENGKPEDKAPNTIKVENGKAVITVKDQFND